jgi:hypothetical protein
LKPFNYPLDVNAIEHAEHVCVTDMVCSREPFTYSTAMILHNFSIHLTKEGKKIQLIKFSLFKLNLKSATVTIQTLLSMISFSDLEFKRNSNCIVFRKLYYCYSVISDEMMVMDSNSY